MDGGAHHQRVMGNTCGVTLRSKYFASFRGASQRHDEAGYAPVATSAAAAAAADEPAGKKARVVLRRRRTRRTPRP